MFLFTLPVCIAAEETEQKSEKPPGYPPKLKGKPLSHQLRKNVGYPDEADRQGIFGMVIARAHVNVKGRVDSVAILAGHTVFHKNVIKGLRKLSFEPARTHDKTPVPFWLDVPVNFIENKGPLRDLKVPARLIGPPLSVQLAKLVRYPAKAKEESIEGVVVATAMIDLEGNVAGVQHIDGPAELQSAAVSAVKKLKYEPALNNKGNPMIYYQPIPVWFSLKEIKTIKARE
jgi:TonB family protein